MNALKTAALGLLLAVASTAAALAQPPGDPRMPVGQAPPSAMPSDDNKMMTDCMAMAPSAMAKNPGCASTMKKMNMTNADMKKMSSCRSMSSAMMMKDKKCMAMKEMHPDMMAMPIPSPQMKH